MRLDPLGDHREAARLTLIFKIMHNHVSIPPRGPWPSTHQPPEAPTIRNWNTSEHLPRHTASPLQLALFLHGTTSLPMWQRLTIEAFKSQLAAQATPLPLGTSTLTRLLQPSYCSRKLPYRKSATCQPNCYLAGSSMISDLTSAEDLCMIRPGCLFMAHDR